MTFFDIMGTLKRESPLTFGRRKVYPPAYMIYWDSTKKIFCETYANTSKEWVIEEHIDDLNANDWGLVK